LKQTQIVSLSKDAAAFAIDGHKQAPMKDFRLLLVEDNQTNQQVAVSTLAQMGYKVESVFNGRQAVAALRETAYDLVFMDCHMPEMDGFEATAEIRRSEPATRRTPIIAMTASALPEDRARRHELDAVLERWLHETPQIIERLIEEAVSTSPEPWHLEPETLHNLRLLGGGNPTFLYDLIDLFLRESVGRLASLNESLLKRDFAAIPHLAHTQRGACLSFGAHQMAEMCGQLENIDISMSETGMSEIGEMIARIESEFLNVRRALEAERVQPAPNI
jgi:CheY-like chemotaxis protein